MNFADKWHHENKPQEWTLSAPNFNKNKPQELKIRSIGLNLCALQKKTLIKEMNEIGVVDCFQFLSVCYFSSA